MQQRSVSCTREDMERRRRRKPRQRQDDDDGTSMRCDWLAKMAPQNFRLATPKSRSSTLPLLTPALPTIARRNGEKRYVPHVYTHCVLGSIAQRPRPTATCPSTVPADVHALTATPYSKVPYHHGTPDINGHDRLLPNDAKTACASTAEYAQIRPHRYATHSSFPTTSHSFAPASTK